MVFVSLVSHENIEIFVVIHEKAIQRSLKYEKETRKKFRKNVLILITEEGKLGSASEQKEGKNKTNKKKKTLPTPPNPTDAGMLPPQPASRRAPGR